jgi:polar amino acid transport system ATP-binding protein
METGMTDGEFALCVRGVGKRWDSGDVVLTDVDLDVRRGETVAIIGPSGGGKTTLLRCMNFLVEYDTGTIHADGELIGYSEVGNGRRRRRPEREIDRQRARIGIVFQRFNLFPHRTAIQNAMEGPIHVLGLPKAEARARAERELARVGMAPKANSFPDELSGGQQQRVAIARALCMEPQLLLCDEITSALDPELKGEVLQVMRALARDGMTMVVVTHELDFARNAANRVVFMEAGRIVATDDSQRFFATPPSERIANYLKRVE